MYYQGDSKNFQKLFFFKKKVRIQSYEISPLLLVNTHSSPEYDCINLSFKPYFDQNYWKRDLCTIHFWLENRGHMHLAKEYL